MSTLPAHSVESQLRAALVGLALRDARGVPVEFHIRAARPLLGNFSSTHGCQLMG
ncbi:hypothetical protein MUN84_01590 [Hymenobacter sp. 5516J-16]|uniref:hypothetical protein n=1 Tax=Hymenobacter sp. 5516J-16 TaxID=2932253 RepID=UPI001FD2C989|nr:hypothetical protein [Hymenobacter sp. 5516J-16]UOQ77435.1 hypothetical protein MUN84_01590 [Hymenobacter sp. 5516J-16]